MWILRRGQIAGRGALDAATAVAYAGPGDVISGALGYYSAARAYTAAFAATGAAIMDIVDNAGANPATINILTTGFVDLATLNAWIALHGTASVTKLYDQTGSGNHITNVTLAQMPTINVSALASLPGLVFSSAAGSRLLSANITQAQSISLSVVAMKTATTSAGFFGSSAGGFVGIIGGVAADTWSASAGTVLASSTANDSTFHAAQALFNGASSSISVDGSSTSGNAGSGAFSANPIAMGRGNGATIGGTIMEGIIWAGDKSASFGSLNTNQHGANGFNF